MPQLNETERALMALLQKERERNGAPVAQAPALPDLDLKMFLSPAAQREIEAVQGLPVWQQPIEVPQAKTASTIGVALDDPNEINLTSSDWNITENDLEPAPRYASEQVAPDLENLFMDRALRETGGSMSDQRRAERLGTDLDFSFASSDIEIDDSPRMYESPPPMRSSGGVEVARRGPGGFQQLSRAEAVARSEARSVVPQRHVQASAPQAPQAVGKSRYERLLGPSIID